MHTGNIFHIGKGTRIVAIITLLVSLIALFAAIIYYGGINRSEDPRISVARDLLASYDALPLQSDLTSKIRLIDSAGTIFRSYADYADSFEMGVVFNNKASALMVAGLYDSTVTPAEKATLLKMAMTYIDSSIAVYRRWIQEWTPLNNDEVELRLRTFMKSSDPAFKDRDYKKLIARRTKNQLLAQVETPRRLSVCLSNKGIIFRHMEKPDSASMCLQESLSLWNNNRVAKSNLNVLMGGEPLKPGIIESLFPPDRKKSDIKR
jgi:hypothetical protein